MSTQVVDYYTSNFKITQKFGQAIGMSSNHYGGIAFANAKQGDSVKSFTNGKVATAYYSPTGGYMVVVQQDDGTIIKYMHMQKELDVKSGDEVVTGQQLGRVGNTGRSTGAHLQVQVEQDGCKIDPEIYLNIN